MRYRLTVTNPSNKPLDKTDLPDLRETADLNLHSFIHLVIKKE